MMSAEGQVICPDCGSSETMLLGKLQDARQFAGKVTTTVIHGGSLYRCTSCYLKFRFPIESAARYNELYDHGDADNWTVDIPRPDWDLIAGHLETAVAGKQSVLDFGCNTGGFLARVPPGIARFGVEINQAAAQIAESTHGAKVWSSIDAIPTTQQFDFIVAVDVVEHVPNPGQLVEALLARLTEGGELILTTGDADNKWWDRFGANWWYCFHPEHIAFISERWLSSLEGRSNAKVVQARRFRYRELGTIAKLVHSLFMILYGVLPSLYLAIRNAGRRLASKPEVASVLGNGVSADHLFVVLSRKTHGQ